MKLKGKVFWNLKSLITDILQGSKEERADRQKIKCCQEAMVNTAQGSEARPIIKLVEKMRTQMILMMQ
jgi:hypothetical protein